MAELSEQLKALEPTVTELLAVSCAPGLSLGVLYRGEVVHTAHFGRRDTSDPAPPNDDTIYRVASLTKVLTSSAVALLVKDGTLDWDRPIREYLPAFRRRTDELGKKATLRDLLSNRTGLPDASYMWGQQYGEFLMPQSELVRITTFLEAVRPFRQKFFYSQWNYGLVTEIVEAVTGMTLGSYIKDKILDPIGMQRTTLGLVDDENVAAGHAPCNDGTPCRVSFPNMNDGVGLAGGFAGKSTLKDLLVLYKGLLRAQQDQARTQLDSTPGSPFVHTSTLFGPQIAVGNSVEKLAYCMGLYRTRLPGPLGVASINSGLLGLKRLPVMGKSSPGLEVYHHTGNIPGFVASAFLVPSTESAVVVLANALPFMDPTDLAGQLALSVLIGEEAPADFVPLAKKARDNGLRGFAALAAAVEKRRTTKPPRLPLGAYEGRYWNAVENFCITVSRRSAAEGGGLLMKVQDAPRTTYELEPYDGDTFYWPPDREKELCEKGMWLNLLAASHMIAFGAAEDGRSIGHLTWHCDTTASPEVFHKRDSSPPQQCERSKL